MQGTVKKTEHWDGKGWGQREDVSVKAVRRPGKLTPGRRDLS